MTSAETGRPGPLERAWQRLSDREAARLRDAFLHSPEPRGSSRRALGFALAALVLAGYVATLAVALWLGWLSLGPVPGVLPDRPFLVRFLLGLAALALLLFAVQARPRFPRLPGREVTGAEAPELHGLIREVAGALGVSPPARFVVDGEVNAFMGRSGFPPQPTLGLGLPLLYALPPQERVAVIAHELAHLRNGDPTRGGVVGFALGVLAHAVGALTPDGLMEADEGPLAWASRGVMRLLALVPLGLYHLLLGLVGEDQQRAEFRADLLAAEVAGTEATVSSLDHLHLADSLEGALHKQRHFPERPHAFLELRHVWATTPQVRRQERREERAARRTRLDATHPPTADRMAVVGAHPKAPRVVLTPERAARIEAELTPLVRPIEQAAYEAYQARYAGW